MRSPRRWGLVGRVVALVVLACTITAALGLAISVPLVAGGANDTARSRLARLADLATSADYHADRTQTRAALAALKIRVVLLDPSGTTSGSFPRVEQAVSPATVRAVLAGRSVSTTSTVAGHDAFVEARPLPGGGGIALVERQGDATESARSDLYRTLWALLAAVVIVVAVGAVAVRRALRPLRQTTAAAHLLAAGRRDVHVDTDAPREVAEVAEALNGLTAALARSEGRQREFLLSVSHDLRTPLTAITGYAESLRTGVVAGVEAQEFVVGIETEARRLERMVADLLDLARLQADDVHVELRPVDLTETIVQTARAWAPRCEAAGLRLVVPGVAAPVVATTDPGRLRQILDCLLDNAVRVCPPAAPVVVELRPLPLAEPWWAATVEVRDGGPGLTDDDLAVAFERGVLHERYRGVRPGGTGLGLAIVGSLARRLGLGLGIGHAVEGGVAVTLAVPRSHPGMPPG